MWTPMWKSVVKAFFQKDSCLLTYWLQCMQFHERRNLGWETENISGLLLNFRVITLDFLSFWNQWDPVELPKSIWAEKSAVFSYLGSHMWHNTKIQKMTNIGPKWKWKIFLFLDRNPSYIHNYVWKHVN